MSYNYPRFTLAHPFPEPRPKEKYGYHGGADYAAEAGTPVPALFGGTVFRTGYINGHGMAVVIETKTAKGSVYTLYGHLGPNGLPKATNADGTPTVIQPGQAIGEVASRAFNETFKLHYNPHLHLEIIDGNAPVKKAGNFGIMSSDLTYRANPETFDINNPQFPYENTGHPPKPGQAPADSLRVAPSEPRVLPGDNLPRTLSPSIVPSAPHIQQSQPRNPGPPVDIRPPAQSGSPGPIGSTPIHGATLPPLYFAPETRRNFGPFIVAPSPGDLLTSDDRFGNGTRSSEGA